MADSILTPGALLDKLLAGGEMDFLREALTAVAREIMELEVQKKTGAGRGERSPERLAHRNGYRERRWDTRAGSVLLPIPKVREGSYFPSFLEPRRRSEEALMAVVCEAYVKGVSPRKVEDLVQAMGIHGVSKSEVSRICTLLDERVAAFRGRPLVGRYPYLWLDARYEKVRDDSGRVVSMALAVAYGVAETGERTPMIRPTSGGYLNDNLLAVQRALGLGRDDLFALAGNAVEAAFVDEGRRRELRGELESFALETRGT
jgi:putative transposase